MPQPKKSALSAIVKAVAKKSAAKKAVSSAKKEASKTLKNAGKAGSPMTEKVVIGAKTRKKMAEGKFGNKAMQGPAAKQKSTSTGNVKKRPGSNPFAGMK